MMINELLDKLKKSETPVSKIIENNECGKIILLAFKKDMILKEHKTNTPAKLLIIKGEVIYTENKHNKTLKIYDSIEIPVDVLHSVKAIKDSICILIK